MHLFMLFVTATLFQSVLNENPDLPIQAKITGNWKLETPQTKPNIEPQDLYELGGYIYLNATNGFVLSMIENPLDHLNDYWLDIIYEQNKNEVISDQPDFIPFQNKTQVKCPFESITFAFDYWVAFDPKHRTQDIIMSICGAQSREEMRPFLWMFTAVSFNLENFLFQNVSDMVKCIRSIQAYSECHVPNEEEKNITSNSCEASSLALKNIQVIYKYAAIDKSNSNLTLLKFDGASLNQKSEAFQPLSSLPVHLNKQPFHDLIIDCGMMFCYSFYLDNRPIETHLWSGAQSAPFEKDVIEQFFGTDKKNHWLQVQLNSSLFARCLRFKYFVGFESTLDIQILTEENTIDTIMISLRSTIRENNNDLLNLSYEWYENELCLDDFLPPVQLLQKNQSANFRFTANTPTSGGYVALTALSIAYDPEHAQANLNRTHLSSWTTNGAEAAEQWCLIPTDSRWSEPVLDQLGALSIKFKGSNLLGQSGYTLMSSWFKLISEQELRFQIHNQFEDVIMYLWLLDANYSVVWESYGSLKPSAQGKWVVLNLDEICKTNGNTSHCGNIGNHLRWSLQFEYDNVQTPIETQSLVLSQLDQSDVCSKTVCASGGKCVADGANVYHCECKDNFYGKHCEYLDQCKKPLPGQKNGDEYCASHGNAPSKCIRIGSSYRCDCSSQNGYYWSEIERQCLKIQPCSLMLCGMLEHCVHQIKGPICECIDGYKRNENGTCVELNPCNKEDLCPPGARCISLDKTKEHLCYCDVQDGQVRSENGSCVPLLNNPFVQQANLCYMDYEIENSNSLLRSSRSLKNENMIINSIDNNINFDIEESLQSTKAQKKEQEIIDRLNSPVPVLESLESFSFSKKITCSCLNGYTMHRGLCVPDSKNEDSLCDPQCEINQQCVANQNRSLPNYCECKIGFTGSECKDYFCQPQIGGSFLRSLCGINGCSISISPRRLQFFHCNCDTQQGYRVNELSGLCEQIPLCEDGSEMVANCASKKAVCAVRQNDQGGLLESCECPVGFGWSASQNQCVPLCELDTRCSIINAQCELELWTNSTKCICQVGRRFDPLRSACVLQNPQAWRPVVNVFKLQATIMLNYNEFLHKSFPSIWSNSINCANSLDPPGCVQQLRRALNQLRNSTIYSLNLKQLYNSVLEDRWVLALQPLFTVDLVQVIILDAQWENEYKNDFLDRPINVQLIIQSEGFRNWTEETIHDSCVPLLYNSSDHFCALPPSLLLKKSSVKLRKLDICEDWQSLKLCSENAQIRCSKDGRFSCECAKGYRSQMSISQDVQGSSKFVNQICTDINECKEKKICLKSHEVCVNLPGSYECQCEHGFKKLDNLTCSAICEDVNCGNGNCVFHKSTGGFYCSCLPGYFGSNCEFEDEHVLRYKLFTYILLTVTIALTTLIILLLAYICLRCRQKSSVSTCLEKPNGNYTVTVQNSEATVY